MKAVLVLSLTVLLLLTFVQETSAEDEIQQLSGSIGKKCKKACKRKRKVACLKDEGHVWINKKCYKLVGS